MPAKEVDFIMLAPRSVSHAAALQHTNQQDHHSQNQQKVDESTERVRSDDPQQPQNHQNHKNCPKHVAPLFLLLCASSNPKLPRRGLASWPGCRIQSSEEMRPSLVS